MPLRFSMVLDRMGFFDPSLPGMEVHGANLSITSLLRHLISMPDLECLEVFVPPKLIASPDILKTASETLVPAHLQGKGLLHFLPMHTLPEMWGDGRERVIVSIDPCYFARERYLRDRFAKAPTPILVDTHSLGDHRAMLDLARMAPASATDFDCALCLSLAYEKALVKAFTEYITPEADRPPFVTRIVRHSVNTNLFSPPSADQKELVRSTLRLPQNKVITLYFGRLTPNSKADLLPLINAFAEVSGPDHVLLIGGIENTPGYCDRLLKEATDLGIIDRVILRQDIAPELRHLFYLASDLFVFPGDTVQEAMANTVLEATASGLPCLISDWDGMRDLVEHGESGYAVPCFWTPGLDRVEQMSPALDFMTNYLLLAQSVWIDTRALKTHLKSLLEDKSLRERMGRRGREMAEAEYGEETVRQRIKDAAEQMLEVARKESSEAKEMRRSQADALSLPVPYLRIFDHYATGVLKPEETRVGFTLYGEQVAAGRAMLTFYDETMALINTQVLDRLFARLKQGAATMADLADAAAQQASASENDALFTIGLLLKRGVVEVAD